LVIDARVPPAWLPVSGNVADVPTPLTLAVTVREPDWVGAATTEASPLEFVTAVAPFGKLTPVPAKVTIVPLTGLLLASFTTTTSGLGKFDPTIALWPEPETIAMLAGAPVAGGVTVSVALPLE
jgi:hypothetical protein